LNTCSKRNKDEQVTCELSKMPVALNHLQPPLSLPAMQT
jgi:hypothetical protein